MKHVAKTADNGTAGALTVAVEFLLAFAGCGGSGTEIRRQGKCRRTLTRPSSSPSRQEQMSHVQVVTVEPTTLARTLAAHRGGRLQQLSYHSCDYPGERPGEPDRRGSGAAGAQGPADAVRSQSRLFATSHQLSEGEGCLLRWRRRAYARAQGSCTSTTPLRNGICSRRNRLKCRRAADLAARRGRAEGHGNYRSATRWLRPRLLLKFQCWRPSGERWWSKVSPGQLLQTGTTHALPFPTPARVWVLVNVYQKDLPYVHVGDPVTIQTDAYPDVFQGRISYIAASLDPNTRTLPARIETINPGEKLKKDMYVIATVRCGQNSERPYRSRLRGSTR